MPAPMGASSYSDIKSSLRHLYLEYLADPRPWLVGFSGGKDSTVLASLIAEVVAGIPDDQRKKPVAILWTRHPRGNQHSTLNAPSPPHCRRTR